MEGGGGSRRLTSFRRVCRSRWRSSPRHRPRCRCQSTDLEQNTPEWVQRVLVSVSSAAAASGLHGGAEHTKVPLGWLKRDKVPSSVAVCALQSVHATDSSSSRLLWCHDDVINYLIYVYIHIYRNIVLRDRSFRFLNIVFFQVSEAVKEKRFTRKLLFTQFNMWN